MPVWGAVLLAVIVGWFVLSVIVALAIGRAIRIADRRGPRKPHARTRRLGRLRHGPSSRTVRVHRD